MAIKIAKSTLSQQRVLDAAARIFRDCGYAGTTMRGVADAAGLQAGSLYYHFPSKEELISAVLDQGISTVFAVVRSAIEQLPETASHRQRIEAAIEGHLTGIIGCGDYTLATRRVFGQVPEVIRVRHMRQRDAYGALWHRMLTEAQAAGEIRADADLRLVRLFLLGGLNWTPEWFKPNARSVREVAREFSALVLDGVAQTVPKPGRRRGSGAVPPC